MKKRFTKLFSIILVALVIMNSVSVTAFAAHKHKGIACGERVVTYEAITNTAHTEVVRYEDICECGEVVGLTTLYKTMEPHVFTDPIRGVRCLECGYQKQEHKHEGVKCGKAITKYEEFTPTTHTRIDANEALCSCNEYVGLVDIKKTVENHTFVGDICTVCWYEREHVHKGAERGKDVRYCSNMTEDVHTFSSGYEELCSCGAYIRDVIVGEVTSSHSFSGDVCKDCGYERAHVHKGARCGDVVEQYEDITETTHTFIRANEDICSCGEYLGLVDVSKSVSEHTFVDDVCSECGYERDSHIHTASVYGNGETYYENATKTTHTVIVYEGDQLCSCGEFVSYGASEEYVEEHVFENSFCIYCEYFESPWLDEEIETVSEEIYVASDANKHVKMTVTMGNENIAYEYEAHDFYKKKCTKCGYSNKAYVDAAVEQAILGDFSEENNTAGIAGQVLVGEIPLIGFVADVRDLVASDTPADVVMNLVGFLPVVGSLKFSDEVYTVVKHADDVTDVVKRNEELFTAAKAVMRGADDLDEVAALRRINRVSESSADGYKSFDAFKKAHGSAGEGYEWHHIVEQNQIEKSGFDATQIHNGNNMIALDAATHRKVSGYYSRKVPGTDMRFRDWLVYKGFTFEEQQKIGVYVLEMYGVQVK